MELNLGLSGPVFPPNTVFLKQRALKQKKEIYDICINKCYDWKTVK